MEDPSLHERIAREIGPTPTPLQKIYPKFPKHAEETVRARIYEYLGEIFERLERGVYIAHVGDSDLAVVKGDAWEELKKLKTGSFDAIITDPPYPWLDHHVETGTTRKKDGELSFETKELDGEILSEFYRVLKDGAHCFIFVPSISKDTRKPLNELIERVKDAGLKFNKYFVWNRKTIGMGYNGRCKYEGILFLSKGERRMPRDKSVPDLISVKRIPPCNRQHETEKPVELLNQLVKFSTEEDDWVLDPFAGSGSTGEACVELQRNCVLIEKEKQFVEKMIFSRIDALETGEEQQSLSEF